MEQRYDKKFVVLGIILFPLFCLLLSFTILYTDPGFTYLLLEKEHIADTKQLFSYFAGESDLPAVFNEQEKAHLQDVRKVLKSAFAFSLIILISFLACFFTNWRKITKYGFHLFISICLLAFIVPFDSLFTKFHHVFFPQGNWQFSVSSTIISYYSQTFFISYFHAIIIHALLIAISFFVFEFVSRKR